MTAVIRVSIVEDHVLVREGMAATLVHSQLHLVGSFSSLAEFCEFEAAAPPAGKTSLLLLDLDLEAGPAEPQIVADLIADGIKVLVVSAMGMPKLIREMVTAGVSGFVAKRDPTESLLMAIRAVINGESWTTPRLAVILAEDPERPNLSAQEERALKLYATGMKLTSVARRLGVQPETAKVYIDRVRAKYAALGRDVRTKTELYIAATADGIIDPQQLDDQQRTPHPQSNIRSSLPDIHDAI